MLQDLRSSDPRVWQAITSLDSHRVPIYFYAEIILPGNQTVAQDVLCHACILRLPIDPYRMWKVQSVLLQDVTITCKQMPTTADYTVDVLITRNKRETFTSLFLSTSQLPTIRPNGDYEIQLDAKMNLGTVELFDNDEFRVDVVSADETVKDCWLVFRGVTNLLRDRPENQ